MKPQKKEACPLVGIYFYLTAGCNLMCRHCWIVPEGAGPENRRELDFDLFRKIIDEARPLGLEFVRLTGGEPLLHSRIERIIEHVRENDFVLDIESNGTLIAPGFSKRLAKVRNKNIAISLDGIDEETHEYLRGVKGSFKKTIAGILSLKTAGVNPELITCVFRKNKDQIRGMIRLAEDLRLKSLNFKIIAPIGRAEGVFDKNDNLSVGELVEIGRWFEEELIPRAKIPVAFGHPPAFRKMSALFGPRGASCGACGVKNILGVLPDGEYALCGIGTLVKGLCFGNAKNEGLDDIRLNNVVINEIREGLPEKLGGICAVCAMKKICRGSCIAENFYLKRNLWSPYWYCDEAHRLGLFPELRMIKRDVPVRI